MLVTRAMANSSKNHTFLMCRIWKMGRNLFSSLDISFFGKKIKQSKNLSVNYYCLGHWQFDKLSQSLMLITRSKSGYLTKFAQKCHFQIISHVQWWTHFFFHFCILHIKNIWILPKLEMALVTTIEMKFTLVCVGTFGMASVSQIALWCFAILFGTYSNQNIFSINASKKVWD